MIQNKEIHTYKRGIFFHIVIITVVTRGPAPPETILAQLVVIATLTLISKPHKRFPVTTLTLDWMKD